MEPIEPNPKPTQLTEAAHKAVSEKSVKKQKKSKPAWAVTEKQSEKEKEDEIDQLLEFAYELDYEKYMEDFEVRQALAVIKDRVNEIKQQPDWKQKLADEWNQTDEQKETKSHVSFKTGQSAVSKQSFIKRVAEAKTEAENKPEWDSGSVNTEMRNKRAQDQMASKIAAEVLKDN